MFLPLAAVSYHEQITTVEGLLPNEIQNIEPKIKTVACFQQTLFIIPVSSTLITCLDFISMPIQWNYINFDQAPPRRFSYLAIGK